jgi:hypothetical protein
LKLKAANGEYISNGVLINTANDSLSGISTKLFEPVPFVAEQEGSEARK